MNAAESGAQAIASMATSHFDLVLTDFRMAEMKRGHRELDSTDGRFI